MQDPEAPLRVRNRIVFGTGGSGNGRTSRALAVIEQQCELSNRWIVENFPERNRETQFFLDPADHLGCFQAVSAEAKKVGVSTDPVDAQNAAPDRRQGPLRLCLGFCIFLGIDPVLLRNFVQSATVNLARRRQREAIENDEIGWYHVIRQPSLQKGPKLWYKSAGKLFSEWVVSQIVQRRRDSRASYRRAEAGSGVGAFFGRKPHVESAGLTMG